MGAVHQAFTKQAAMQPSIGVEEQRQRTSSARQQILPLLSPWRGEKRHSVTGNVTHHACLLLGMLSTYVAQDRLSVTPAGFLEIC
ncbi:hypothetical protein SKAU_G00047780 [Synaphobranchus kaupii]|uniref:Uncharacterized protein n=1 Tax=Synaphobranchus kaupii TaxID=118154 RepID=A0A9Q1G2D1_SYNKA|nr:hypothetical protein SKAU_G00047780 [Synaphobranchus kaupii]